MRASRTPPGSELAAGGGRGGATPEGLSTTQLAEDIFLLLCARRVSTFVGTGVAYVVTPALHWLNDPLKNLALTAMTFRESAMSGEAAFRELKHAASTARESLEKTHQHTHDTWHLVREIHTSVSGRAQPNPPAAFAESDVAALPVRPQAATSHAREPMAAHHPQHRPGWRRLFG